VGAAAHAAAAHTTAAHAAAPCAAAAHATTTVAVATHATTSLAAAAHTATLALPATGFLAVATAISSRGAAYDRRRDHCDHLPRRRLCNQ